MATDTGNGPDGPGDGGINFVRPAVEVWWNPGDTPEDTPVTVRAENLADGTIGTKLTTNDGLTTLTYPAGTQVTDLITVFETANPDNVIAEFTISVKIND